MKPFILCILDGWGIGHDRPDNAISKAHTPCWDHIWDTYPKTVLESCGTCVGLPHGQMGNSEVGHLNMGAGRVVMQTLPRIDKAFSDRTVATIPAFQDMISNLQETGGTCHLMGLLSPGGVHSHQNHLVGLLLLLSQAGIPVVVHAFLDGRDTPPQSAHAYLESLQNVCHSFPGTRMGTLMGRYYAMDRDRRWDRTALAYDAIRWGRGLSAPTALEALQTSYQSEITDEFVKPYVLPNYQGMQDGDAFLMFNFRADRVRQLLSAFVDPSFDHFDAEPVRFCAQVGMTSYSTELDRHLKALFPPENVTETLGEVIAQAGLKQLRIAETEKYAHVTFFFNGGREEIYSGEDRILVPSPLVATYDLCPEMSAIDVTDQLFAELDKKSYDFVVLNYANADMVGHTGDFDAAVKAVETLDQCLNRLYHKVKAMGGALMITADHGNVEQMCAGNSAHTAHTMNPVPCVIISPQTSLNLKPTGKLADIAPTILELMQIKKPMAMTGESLIFEEK